MDFHLRGRDGSLQGAWDQALLSVAMEDGVGEKGQRAEVAEAMQLLTRVYEKETFILSIQLQELAQMSASWEEGEEEGSGAAWGHTHHLTGILLCS